MDLLKLQAKIKGEIKNETEAKNLAQALYNSPVEFQEVVAAWLAGLTPDYSFDGISLYTIQEKEQCSYLKALMRMQLFLSNPTLVSGYSRWKPINKDWGR